MTVSVTKKLIAGPQGLSGLGALVLAFIDGGTEWLAWAAGASALYAFPDETAMLSQVQQGLHADMVTLLPGLDLMVSPVKLMTFSLGDLRQVAKVEGGATDAASLAQAQAILSAHGLLTQADLAAVPAFLANVGAAAAPVLQGLGLNDLIALSELIALPQPQDGNPDIRPDAAAFAQAQARTPVEFADYYRAYLALVGKLGSVAAPTAQRQSQVQAAVDTLAPLMFAALDCPQIGGLAPPAEVAAAIADWLRKGGQVGFSRLSEGVCRIIDSTTFTTETGAAADQVIRQYLANAQSFLAANAPKTGRISQDGRSCTLPIQAGNLYAEILLGPAGAITLRQFRRLPPPAANT